jgi:hypothetical protein
MNGNEKGRGARRTYDPGVCVQAEPSVVVSSRAGKKESSSQPRVSCRMDANDAVQDGRPPSYLSAGRTEEREGPCHTAWVSGSVTSPRRRFLEKIHGFSFFRAPEACDGGRGHGARASAEPERSGAPLPARIGHAIRLLGQCGAGRCAARHVTRGRRVTQADYAGSDLRGMAMWWYR